MRGLNKGDLGARRVGGTLDGGVGGAGIGGFEGNGGHLPRIRELYSGVWGCGVRGASASLGARGGRRGHAAPALREGRRQGRRSCVFDCRVS